MIVTDFWSATCSDGVIPDSACVSGGGVAGACFGISLGGASTPPIRFRIEASSIILKRSCFFVIIYILVMSCSYFIFSQTLHFRDTISFRPLYLVRPCIFSNPVSSRTPHLISPRIFLSIASCRILHLPGSRIFLNSRLFPAPISFRPLASCQTLYLPEPRILPPPDATSSSSCTNKRVKSSKRYPLLPHSPSFALIGPYQERKKTLPLQREKIVPCTNKGVETVKRCLKSTERL